MNQALVLLVFFCVATCAAFPVEFSAFGPPSPDVLIAHGYSEESFISEGFMKPGMKMGSMHEPAGPVGNFECGLRAMDRVLRQHPKKYDDVRTAMKAFQSSMTGVAQPHVADYFGCVVGLGMMLPDCTMMAPVHNSAIMAFLKQGGSDKMKNLVSMSAKAEGFAQHWKEVQQVVCDTSVYNEMNGITNKPAPKTDDMKGMDMKGSHMKGMDMTKESSAPKTKAVEKAADPTTTGSHMTNDMDVDEVVPETTQNTGSEESHLEAAGFSTEQAQRVIQHEKNKAHKNKLAVEDARSGLTPAQEAAYESFNKD